MTSGLKVLYYRSYCLRLCKYTNISIRNCHSNSNNNNRKLSGNSAHSYEKTNEEAMSRASRTIFVNCSGDIHNCLTQCDQLGKIDNVYQVFTRKGTLQTSILVEFASSSSINALHHSASHFQGNDMIPTVTRFLYNQANTTRDRGAKEWVIAEARQRPTLEQIGHEHHLLSDQMAALYEASCLDHHDRVQRYFLASTIQERIQTIIPGATVRLYGSSVSGLGRVNCDVDMSLDISIKPNSKLNRRKKFTYLTQFHESRPLMELVSNLLQCSYPYTSHVQAILRARVPIVRIHHKALNLDADISFHNENSTAETMSELFYTIGHLQPTFLTLVMVVRTWASSVGITQRHPGPWPTNFMLTLLMVYYLQHVELLPPLCQMVTVYGSSYKVQKDISKCKIEKVADADLGTLLIGFFDFYAKFSFESHGISVWDGATYSKTESSALLLQNPLDFSHNSSRNVSQLCVDQLQCQCAAAVTSLDGGDLLALMASRHGDWMVVPHVTGDQMIHNGTREHSVQETESTTETDYEILTDPVADDNEGFPDVEKTLLDKESTCDISTVDTDSQDNTSQAHKVSHSDKTLDEIDPVINQVQGIRIKDIFSDRQPRRKGRKSVR